VSEPDRVDSAEQAVAVDPVAAVVEARAVSRVFPMPAGPVTALHEVTMRIGAGEYVAIAGPSGCGKSTLLHVIGCVDTPTSGDVWIDGQAVATLSDAERSRIRLTRIGFVFQRFFLLPMLSALENVELPQAEAGVAKTERRERARELLDYVGLAHRADHRPAQLSGGEMQRVAIARALANRPRLVLADEPTGELDQATGQAIAGLFDRLHRDGTAVVVVTHDPTIAARAERTLRMRDGRIDDGSTA
jgi:putative ABC transport system ATP-binding protein